MSNIGVKNSILQLIDSIIGQTIDKNQILSHDLIITMCEITTITGREVAFYINRKGEIVDGIIGDTGSVKLKEYREKRSIHGLSGIRCIHTHPNGIGELSQLDISALKSLKLDIIVSMGINKGEIQDSFIAYINNNEDLGVTINGPYTYQDLLNINAFNLINDIENLYNDSIDNTFIMEDNKEKAILVGINSIDDLDELNELLNTAGGIEVGRLVQNITKVDSAYFIGKGKLKELSKEVQIKNADLVIFDNELSGAQIRNIEQELNVKIIDRTQIILDIFAKRASSKEGKLQVELAQLKYLLPRLSGYGIEMSRTGGGIGTRGPGEQKLEVDRRRIRDKISELVKEIKQIKKHRNIQRKSRIDNVYNVCIVGYTNSGKSSLLNALSDSNIYVENQLFATLDPTTRRIKLKGGKEVIITDTVGFIRNLPYDLIDAFKSTLEEVTYADLLLHVVDGSSDYYEKQIDVVNNVLKDLNVDNKPIIFVINKIDKTGDNIFIPLYNESQDTVYISAKEKINLDELLQKIEYYAGKDSKIIELLVPYNQANLISYLYEKGKIIRKEYREEEIYIKGEFNSITAGKVKKYIKN